MSDRWYKNAVIYALDVETFNDTDGDGVGDFRGLTDRLDYLSRLGVNCLWLLPFYPTPNRDNGYDVADYYGVDPRLGTLGDFVEFVHEAESRGIKVLVDLVVNHTSDQHPWFQAAREDPDSPYRDYYVWADEPREPEPGRGTIFPGQVDDVWTYDEVADAYYYHRFYPFEPELNMANERVREEIKRIMGFWLELGIAGFRLDAASHMIEPKGADGTRPDDPHGVMREFRSFVTTRRGNAVLLAEADVRASRLGAFFGDGDEMTMLFNFLLDNYLFLALARESAEPIVQGIRLLPKAPAACQWANFLRNLDELDLERLTESQRADVFEAFAPDEDMRIFGRGIRRRLAPMLDGDRRRIELAFSLLFSLPGTPVFVYGDEIGMGDDLDQPGRTAVRTPMQWSNERNGGFSTADPDDLVREVIDDGPFSYERVNVADQERDRTSLYNWMEQLVHTRQECPTFGWGTYRVLETEPKAVFAHRSEWEGNVLIAVHNLGERPETVSLDLGETPGDRLVDLLGDKLYEPVGDEKEVELEPYGYRWFRVGGLREATDTLEAK